VGDDEIRNVLASIRADTRSIPAIQQKLEEVITEVACINLRLAETDKRQTGLEARVDVREDHGSRCTQRNAIQNLEVSVRDQTRISSELGAKLAASVVSSADLADEVEDVQGSMKAISVVKRDSRRFWLGMLATIILAALGSIWYLGGMGERVDANGRRFIRVETQLNTIGENLNKHIIDTSSYRESVEIHPTKGDRHEEGKVTPLLGMPPIPDSTGGDR